MGKAVIGRTRSRRPTKPRDVSEFHAAIQEAARELDFALRMYAVELSVQGFTDEEIIRELRSAFVQAAKTIIGEWPED